MRRQAFRLYLLCRLVSLDLHVKQLHLQAEEETTIVSDLTDLVEDNKHEILINLKTIGHYEFYICKG